jgi:hypothetical protein
MTIMYKISILDVSRFFLSENTQKQPLHAANALFRPFLSGHNRDNTKINSLNINELTSVNRDTKVSRYRDNNVSRCITFKTLNIRHLTIHVSRLCPAILPLKTLFLAHLGGFSLKSDKKNRDTLKNEFSPKNKTL